MKFITDAADLAAQRTSNFTDDQINDLRGEVFEVLKKIAPKFSGGSFAFIGDCAGFCACFMIQEAWTVGSTRQTPKAWFAGRRNNKWVLTQLRTGR